MFLKQIEMLLTYLTIDQSFISRIVTKHQEILKNSTVQLQNSITSLQCELTLGKCDMKSCALNELVITFKITLRTLKI